jgi:hypothetical protein
MKKHYEKIMSVATCLFGCNIVLSDTFKLHQTSCNGHGIFIVKSYSLKYNKTKECEILVFGDDLKFWSLLKMKHWICKKSPHFKSWYLFNND